MKVYVIDEFSSHSLIEPDLISELMHTNQKVAKDKDEAIKYAKDTIEDYSKMYRTNTILSGLFDGRLGEKTENDNLMRYSIGPADRGLYMMLINISEYEI